MSIAKILFCPVCNNENIVIHEMKPSAKLTRQSMDELDGLVDNTYEPKTFKAICFDCGHMKEWTI